MEMAVKMVLMKMLTEMMIPMMNGVLVMMMAMPPPGGKNP
jgi:hypothetical protein